MNKKNGSYRDVWSFPFGPEACSIKAFSDVQSLARLSDSAEGHKYVHLQPQNMYIFTPLSDDSHLPVILDIPLPLAHSSGCAKQDKTSLLILGPIWLAASGLISQDMLLIIPNINCRQLAFEPGLLSVCMLMKDVLQCGLCTRIRDLFFLESTYPNSKWIEKANLKNLYTQKILLFHLQPSSPHLNKYFFFIKSPFFKIQNNLFIKLASRKPNTIDLSLQLRTYGISQRTLVSFFFFLKIFLGEIFLKSPASVIIWTDSDFSKVPQIWNLCSSAVSSLMAISCKFKKVLLWFLAPKKAQIQSILLSILISEPKVTLQRRLPDCLKLWLFFNRLDTAINMKKLPGSFCLSSNLSARVIQPSFDAKSVCILHSGCTKKSTYANRWSLDDSLAEACCMSTAGNDFEFRQDRLDKTLNIFQTSRAWLRAVLMLGLLAIQTVHATCDCPPSSCMQISKFVQTCRVTLTCLLQHSHDQCSLSSLSTQLNCAACGEFDALCKKFTEISWWIGFMDYKLAIIYNTQNTYFLLKGRVGISKNPIWDDSSHKGLWLTLSLNNLQFPNQAEKFISFLPYTLLNSPDKDDCAATHFGSATHPMLACWSGGCRTKMTVGIGATSATKIP
ncbi:hypothetical protein VP01_1288g4 [Puccinia sorghi]|uniref:Uncharacterized protein n=1 Tax=Puccinia sorghi TaxID=27349 RepID=A0A0L6VNT5_9BASI|nr:hypothetical protein VP01_1288g4 [Puccinia sorghi]